FIIGFEVFQLVHQEFSCRNVFHIVQQTTQNPCTLQLIILHQQLFAASAGTTNVDRRVDTLFSNLAIKVQFQVAGTFKFFVDYFVHLGAGIDQRGSDNAQAAAFFDV